MDLDQALHIERSGDGYVVHYAIADVAAFVSPGDPVDVEAHRRGETLYGADRKVPLHPQVLSEDAGSLLAGPGAAGAAVDDPGRRDRRGHRRPRRAGAGAVDRAADLRGRAAARSTTASADEVLLAAQGGRRAADRTARRRAAGCRCRCPSRRSTSGGEHWTLEFRRMLPVEQWNAQISLLTGFGAASLMVYARVGAAAHAAAAGPARRTAAAPHREGAGHRVAGRAALPRLHPRASTRPCRPTRRWSSRARGCCAAAATSPSTARCPPSRSTPRWPRSTPTSRRRCAAWWTGTPARSASRCAPSSRCPTGCWRRCPRCRRRCSSPAAGPAATRTPSSTWSRRGCSPHRVGEEFDAVVVSVDEKDPTRGVVMLKDPGVEAPVVGSSELPLGNDVRVTLAAADVATRKVEFRPLESPDHPRRVADGDDVGREVLGHHRAGADHGVLADRDARADDGAAAEPHVVADGDRLRRLPLLPARLPGSTGCVGVSSCTLGPICTSSPIVIGATSSATSP